MGIGGAAGLLALGGLKALPADELVRPPGGRDEDRLMARCVRCERCIEACPMQALRPARIEEGIVAARTPTVNFDDSWCTFCGKDNDGHPLCVQACKTGALKLDEGATFHSAPLGRAYIERDWCLAWARRNGCRECYIACRGSYRAIEIDEYQRPVVIAEKCVGCGECQHACISLDSPHAVEGATSRAIVVIAGRAANRAADSGKAAS